MHQPLREYPVSNLFSEISFVQELLLKAAVLGGEPAIISWRKWLSCSDINLLDAASRNLLPLVYFNLQQLGVTDPELKKLKGVMRLNWTQNQMRFAKCKSLLRTLHGAGIPILLLKGAALLVYYYPNFGLRRMGDIDILIPARWTAAAMDVLHDSGWRAKDLPRRRLMQTYRDLFYALPFKDGAGDIIDLHWHVMMECTSTEADADFWKNARRRQLDEFPVFILNPTDQLFHTCVHGIKHFLVSRAAQSITWITDAKFIFHSSYEMIDFARLQDMAQKYRLVLALREALTCLVERFAMPIPPDFLHKLGQLPASKLEKREFVIHAGDGRILNYLPARWIQFLRYQERWDCRFRFGDFAALGKFMQRYYDLHYFWQLPFKLFLKVLQKIVKH